MSKIEAKKIVKRYAKKLKEKDFSFKAIYLFGSQIKNKSNKWSDIDVAVVSNKLAKILDKNRWQLWNLRMEVDTRIEPHGFTVKDFANNEDPLVYEIKKTGIKVA